jgi:hypothetical protein
MPVIPNRETAWPLRVYSGFRAAVTVAHAPATRKIYRFAWAQWER